MRKGKKIITTLICLALIVGLVATNAFAATTNIGNTTHNFSTGEPYHFRLQGDVTYSKLVGNEMIIDTMQARIWNYSDSAGNIVAPTFIANDGKEYHTSENQTTFPFEVVPPGTQNSYHIINWTDFVDRVYEDDNNYEIPAYQNQPGYGMYTLIGVYTEDYFSGSAIPFNYTAYWHGNGYVRILNNVANSPYTTSITVSPVGSPSSLSEAAVGSAQVVGSADGRAVIELSNDSQQTTFFTSAPEISYNSDFSDAVQVDLDEIVAGDDGSMLFSVDGEVGDTIYVKAPDYTLVDDNFTMTATNTADIDVYEEADSENDSMKRVILSYDADTFSVVPKSASIEMGGESVEAIYASVFYDEDNNVLGGALQFYVPETFELGEYELVLQGRLVDVTGEVYQINF